MSLTPLFIFVRLFRLLFQVGCVLPALAELYGSSLWRVRAAVAEALPSLVSSTLCNRLKDEVRFLFNVRCSMFNVQVFQCCYKQYYGGSMHTFVCHLRSGGAGVEFYSS